MSALSEEQAKSLENIEESLTKEETFVSWKVFAATITALAAIFVFALNYLMSVDAKAETRLNDAQTQNTQIQTQLSQIQTDLAWIKLQLTEKK